MRSLMNQSRCWLGSHGGSLVGKPVVMSRLIKTRTSKKISQISFLSLELNIPIQDGSRYTINPLILTPSILTFPFEDNDPFILPVISYNIEGNSVTVSVDATTTLGIDSINFHIMFDSNKRVTYYKLDAGSQIFIFTMTYNEDGSIIIEEQGEDSSTIKRSYFRENAIIYKSERIDASTNTIIETKEYDENGMEISNPE
jgi:hypothetical protein